MSLDVVQVCCRGSAVLVKLRGRTSWGRIRVRGTTASGLIRGRAGGGARVAARGGT